MAILPDNWPPEKLNAYFNDAVIAKIFLEFFEIENSRISCKF